MTSITHAEPATIASATRRIAFKALAILLALTLTLFGGQLLLAGWFSEVHAVHELGWGVLEGLLMVGALVACLIRPALSRAALRQLGAAATALLVTMVLVATFDAFTIVLAVMIGGLVALDPLRGAPPRASTPDRALAFYVAVAAVPLVLYALDQASLQRTLDDVHASRDHYTGMTGAALAIPLVAAVAALGAEDSRLPAWTVGLAAIVLGAASLAFSDQPSAFSTVGAALAVTGGAGFVALAELRRRAALPALGSGARD